MKRVNPRSLPYPPGPRRWSVIGNLFDLATTNEAAAYNKLAQKHGEMFFFSVLGQNILFVNSFQVAYDLFEKRSSIYSDRKRSVMMNDLVGRMLARRRYRQDWDWSFGHMPYGDRWKAHKKVFCSEFQQSSVQSYAAVHLKAAKILASRLLRSPCQLKEHLRSNAAAVTMGKALEGMAAAAKPGQFFVDFLPIPIHEMRDSPFDTVKRLLVSIAYGTAAPSFVSNRLLNLEPKGDNGLAEEIIRNCAGLAYAGQTISALSTFILAMVLSPEIVQKAHKELDKVVAHNRLPNEADRARLPFVEAIVKEVLRFAPSPNSGLPHMLSEDDEYNGYFIPAGTIVVGNTWTILHDPSTFPDPHKFNPDRFLHPSPRTQSLHTPTSALSSGFGYGRRACPGRFLADQQLFITFATILSLFEIGPGLDENGGPVPVEARFTSGMICHPLSFQYTIKPRGQYVKKLLESE
ncbi:O-methylsterigmatocystin oxidoreductase [Ephemerocybe angulata]|uniref:O-methylsterigmatocystin oxidoreductase n=1 Tax=Ephemerocybe angulata TaxID=980116 RepID=A0A8H6HTI1_9AGAR|nr:O-methylsterigmatocystin oxidoreductase [Tulosesus angulatus]